MITCETLQEAQAVESVIHCHIERNGTVSAYQEGDALPPELMPQPVNPAQEQIEQLESDMPRKLREVWLKVIAPTLPAGNKERVRVQKIDAQIVELRKKL